jgi:hypothetical protein
MSLIQVMDACLRCQAESKVDARSSGSAAKVSNPILTLNNTSLY